MSSHPTRAREPILNLPAVISLCLVARSEEHTSELQSRQYLVCRLLLEKKKILLRLLTAPGRKPAAVWLLSLIIVVLLISDVISWLSRLDSNCAVGGPIYLSWFVYYDLN